jgi:outer membrane lipoprotein-sorting protein
MIRIKAVAVMAIGIVVAILLSSCAAGAMFGEEINRAFNGVPATMTTYNQTGQKIDQVKGSSFRVTRDTRFDTTTSNSDGTSSNKNDSQVLMISVGNSHISHVGSSMILAQDGLTEVTADTAATVELQNNQPGIPILNDIIEKHRNLWQGKSKTLMIRSQNGTPIAVYAGNQVEAFANDVPKSTAFRIDGKYLLVYRSDYTVYDNDLIGK